MLTLRMFHTRLLSALAVLGLPLPRTAGSAAGSRDDRWLNRLTFGATPSAREEVARLVPGNGMDFGERICPATEVIAASLIRAVPAETQLRNGNAILA